jgi:hypothetical protein
MNEFLGIVFMNDFREWNFFRSNHVAMFAATAGNHQTWGLLVALYGMENNIFLQHAVFAEGCAA